MIVLYINNEHCTSLDQLKGYFSEDTTPGSDVYDDLIDYGRHGEIAAWLRQEGEPELSSKMESIPTSLSDSSFYVHMKAVITGVKDTGPIKPSFDRCFQFEDLICDLKETEANVSVRLKVLMSVNEDYELSVSSNWGTRGMIVNPYSHPEGKLASFDFTLRKRPGKDIGEITVIADRKELSDNKKFSKSSDSSVEFHVGDVKFEMIHVEGGMFIMGATPEQGNDASEHEKPAHKVKVRSFFLCKTLVTQKLWTAIMEYNPSRFKGDLRPVTNVTYKECLTFITNLNKRTGKQFRLPTEEEWEYAAKDGNREDRFKYSGGNKIDEIAWYDGNAEKVTHDVATKKANRLGLYDMSGNVWEWCSSNYGEYEVNKTKNEDKNKKVTRGGCATSMDKGCRTSRRYKCNQNYKSNYLGFRLAI